MASRGDGTVSVGRLINPVDSLSSSLTGLSRMYADQSSREQAKKAQDHRLELLDKKEARSLATFNNAEATRIAGENFNKWAMSDAATNHVFDNSSMEAGTAKYVSDLQAKLTAEQKELSDSIGSGKASTALFKQNLLDSGLSETESDNRVLERTKSIISASNDLYGLNNKDRIAKIQSYSDSLYKPRFEEIQNDIRTGKHLSRGERAKSLLKTLDPEMVSKLSYERLNKIVGEKAGGWTIDELNANEAAAAAAANEAARFNIKNSVSIYNKVNGARKNSSAAFTGKDLDNYVVAMDGLDIGWWDNADAKKAASALIDAGYHPSAVVSVVKENINKGIIDDTFFDKDKDSKAFGLLAEQAKARSRSLGKDRLGNTTVSLPDTYKPVGTRTIGDIRKMRMRYGTSSRLRLKDFVPQDNNAAYMVDPDTGIGPAAYATQTEADTERAKVSNTQVSAYNKLNAREKLLAYDGLTADTKAALKVQYDSRNSLGPNDYDILPEASDDLRGIIDNINLSTNHKGINTDVINAKNKRITEQAMEEFRASDTTSPQVLPIGIRRPSVNNNRAVLDAQAADINAKNDAITDKAIKDFKDDLLSSPEVVPRNLRRLGPNNNRAVLDAQAEAINAKNSRITNEGVDNFRNSVLQKPAVDGVTGAAITDRSNVLPKPSNTEVKAYETDNSNKPLSKRAAHPAPKLLHGNDAVAAVESKEGKLSALEKKLVMDEGYSKDVYADSKGNLTTGVGQTGKFMDGTAKAAIATKIKTAKKLVPSFDSMPEDVQYSVLQAVYRGDVTKNHKWLQMLNAGNYLGAAREVLNHEEYNKLKSAGIDNGITRRIEEASAVFGRQVSRS